MLQDESASSGGGLLLYMSATRMEDWSNKCRTGVQQTPVQRLRTRARKQAEAFLYLHKMQAACNVSELVRLPGELPQHRRQARNTVVVVSASLPHSDCQWTKAVGKHALS